MQNYLQSLLGRENAMIFLAWEQDRIVGFLSAIGGRARRNHRTVEIVVGIMEAFTGQGVGKALFKAAEEWARLKGFHRLELGCMAHNQRAFHLYRKLGFLEEGRKREVYFVNGEYVDEIIMGKILSSHRYHEPEIRSQDWESS